MASTYDPAKVLITYNGVRLAGFADGTFCDVEANADDFTLAVGADGEVARSASADDSGEVKVTLLQTSAGNDYLNAQRKLDKLTKSNVAGALLVQDLSGRTLVVGVDCWLKRGAKLSFGKEIEGREWTIVCGKLDQDNGGN